MVAVNQAPIPTREPVIQAPRFKDDPLAWLMTTSWIEYLSTLIAAVDVTPSRVNSVELEQQNASIGATDFSAGAISAGLYRVSYFARITRAATTSSSLTVAFDWTTGSVVQSFTGAAITGNATNSNQPDNSLLIRVDAVTPIRYSTTYASTGATSMEYSLDIVLERIQG